ncbi:MAG TPA: molybdenum cofactor biosynthesis protein MoaE, partial [Candidatus Dormibacteraeota bacterium]|nr:molybdenum cofactor biosynthesis protein MoaE [Candidatus Dormibacteraeota bacterium]
MKRQLTITSEPVDEKALLAHRSISPMMGAAIYFLGVVRGTEGADAIASIDYEAFQPMVQHQFGLLFDQMEKR